MEDNERIPKNFCNTNTSNILSSSEISQKKLDPNLNFDNKYKIIDIDQSESSLSRNHENSNSDIASLDTMSTSSKTTNESFVKNIDPLKDINPSHNSFRNNKNTDLYKNNSKETVEKSVTVPNIHYLDIEEKILKPQFKNNNRVIGLNSQYQKDGYGILNYKNGNKFYDGILLNNQMNGYGVIYYEDGKTIKHEGYFRENMYHGPGRAYRKNFSKKFVGQFENGYYCGKGTYFYNNKNNSIKYEGDWRKSKKFGLGIRYYDHSIDQKNKLDNLQTPEIRKSINETGNYIRYTGDWESDVRCGNGTAYNKDGFLEYRGQWKDDKYHGTGVKFFCYKGKGNSNSMKNWTSCPLHSGNFYKGNLSRYCRRYYTNNVKKRVEACLLGSYKGRFYTEYYNDGSIASIGWIKYEPNIEMVFTQIKEREI